MQTIVIDDPVASLLFGRIRQAVLTLLLEHPDRDFYLREIAAMVGRQPGTIQRELALLVEAGILTRRKRGRQVFFQANVACPVFSELSRLVTRTAGLAAMIRRALSVLGSRLDVAFIYGSFASGQQTPRSDVDLLVVGDVSFEDVIGALHGPDEISGREINPTVYTRADFISKIRERHSFARSLLDRPCIELIGSRDDFRRLAAGGMDTAH